MLSKDRKERLDNLFLFVLGIATLGFTIVQSSSGYNFNSLVTALPVLLTGVAFPLYVGYLRGAIILDSELERLRGWIILIVGNFMMLALLISVRLGNTDGEIIVALMGLGVAWFIGLNLARIYEVPLTLTNRKILIGSGGAGFLFPLGFIVLFAIIGGVTTANNLELVAIYSVYVYFAIFLLVLLIVFERTCEKYPLGDANLGERNRIERWWQKVVEPSDEQFSRTPEIRKGSLAIIGFISLALRPVSSRVIWLFIGSIVIWFPLDFFLTRTRIYGWLPVAIFGFLVDALLICSVTLYLSATRK